MSTIVALATALGRSAIGVVRLSGPESVAIAGALIGQQNFSPQAGRVMLKGIKDPETGGVIDQVLLGYFKGPHSFTGEDVVELSCHGSPVVLRQIIDLALGLNARLAGPGEFTLRALANGKINLSQAEGIRDLIDAKTMAAARNAVRQLHGELSQWLKPTKEILLSTIVTLESAVEFVEDDLPEVRMKELGQELQDVIQRLGQLASTFRSGVLLRNGLRVAIIGRPNVGKSSLFNRLLKADRAIVTEFPGTTRDSLTESIAIEGMPILLTDTAGVHEAKDAVERIGIERTRRAMADADLLLLVLDGATELLPEDVQMLADVSGRRHVVAINKVDLVGFDSRFAESIESCAPIEVSAITGHGVDRLWAAILEPFGTIDSEEATVLISDARHYDQVCRAKTELEAACSLLEQGASEELVLVGLHNALRFLGEITGETTPEEVLSRIFATFCIGK
ncbi:MAG TPA: tRNA uridine-5-carboxymethylaminomethyl(34) synthesis GTPase MnmE [Pyrinomonadaceae bacterium]|nr:tRNA uridine-5-carboxymethylaminomethyl(34) synthesis GTPase MnmE [Pyrinomonadaceae bacterium]